MPAARYRWPKALFFLLVGTVATTTPRAHAGLLETLSSGAYYLALESCESIDEAAATEAIAGLERDCQCSKKEDPITPLRKITDFFFGPNSKLENRFFNVLGHEHAKDLRCMARKVEEAGASGDVEKKLPLLKALRQDMQASLKALARPEVVGKICPTTLEDLKRDHNPSVNAPYFNACLKMIQSRTAYEAVVRSIPGSELPEFRGFLDSESLNQNPQGEAARRVGLATSRASTQLRELAQGYQVPEERPLRIHLMTDPGLVQRVVEKSADQGAMRALACQSDARYGKGATRLDVGLTVGSVALTGGAALTARAGSLAHKVIQGTTMARAQGLVSARTAKVLQVSALAMDSVSAYSSIEAECLGGRSASQTKLGESACSEDSRGAEMAETNCVLAKTLAALQFGVLATTLVPKGYEKLKSTTAFTSGPSPSPTPGAPPSPASPELAVPAAARPLKGNEKMAAEVKLRQTAKPWPERAKELARETIEKRISKLEMQIPSAVRRRPPDPALIAEAEKELVEKLTKLKVIRTKGLESEIDDYINARIFEAMIDRKKTVEFLAKDAHAHLSRTADYKSRAELDRHLKAIEETLRSRSDDALDNWLDDGARGWDALVTGSRQEGEQALEWYQSRRWERANELLGERRFKQRERRAEAELPVLERQKLERFQKGEPRDKEKADYQIWKLIGKPDYDVDSKIERYREILAGIEDLGESAVAPAIARRNKAFADELVEYGVIEADSLAYREHALGHAATAERLPPQPGLGMGQFKIPSDVATACPQCPPVVRLRVDPHYDAHVWERASDFGQGSPEARVPAVASIGRMGKMGEEIETAKIANLDEIKHFMGDVAKNVAREKVKTDLWTTAKRNWFLENLKNAKWGPPTPSEKNKNHMMLTAEHGGTRVTMVLCVREPCSPKHIRPGEIASIYPNCGAGVFTVPFKEKLERSLAALSQPVLTNNGKFRDGLIMEKPCK